MSAELDLTDPEVREMAEHNHEPQEMWTMAGQLMSVSCRACGHAWPCPTKVALREIASR